MQAMTQAGLTEALGLGRSTLQTKISARGANATQMSLHSNHPGKRGEVGAFLGQGRRAAVHFHVQQEGSWSTDSRFVPSSQTGRSIRRKWGGKVTTELIVPNERQTALSGAIRSMVHGDQGGGF